MDVDKDWKENIGFPINYSSDQSDEDFDDKDVVTRKSSSLFLLNDQGDGAEADLLGTTPPRARIRGKLKKKSSMDMMITRDSIKRMETSSVPQLSSPGASERIKRLITRKFQRTIARDLKQDSKADSLPPASPVPNVPTLVESCSRFMSLTSRLKCREDQSCDESEQVETRRPTDESRRVSFHKTFCLLINMGNMEKGCRRTISREEQVWQNELKDLIWLELQARLAGRSLAKQDAFLCAQRDVLPALMHNIRNYRFINSNPCTGDRCPKQDVIKENEETDNQNDRYANAEQSCLSLQCNQCSMAVGAAMKEVATLLDSFYNATMLYPSTKALIVDHPLVATHLFQNRLKAMCLWYNVAHYMRLKILTIRRMLRTMELKSQRRGYSHFVSSDSDISRQSSENRQCQVRFTSPSDSNNSDSSGLSDPKEQERGEVEEKEKEGDEVDSSCEKRVDQSGQTTPEIVISDAKYNTSDTTTSSESGYSTTRESDVTHDDVYDLGSLDDVTKLRLLDKCAESPYRIYHREMLKTQGVRRCMTFISKMRMNVLHKVQETLVKFDLPTPKPENEAEDHDVFHDAKEEDHRAQNSTEDEDSQRKYELMRYGCWSEESLAMGLPSYRNHFLLLSTICMEAVHDYLSLRLEDRPQNPSCLTVKQLIHELKEGLDIATETRAVFARHVEVALAGRPPAPLPARQQLLLVVRTYDNTVETVFKQYLSYLRTMSEVEHMSRSCLQSEWEFTARLAKRVRCAVLLAPETFSEITCNQLNRILSNIDDQFTHLSDLESNEPDDRKSVAYALCRSAQGAYSGAREAALAAAQAARGLAARLRGEGRDHYIQAIFDSLMDLRNRLVGQTEYILSRSKIEDPGHDGVASRVRELLLQVFKLGFELHKEIYKFAQGPQKPADMRFRPTSLQPRSSLQTRPMGLRRPRPGTMILHHSVNPIMIHKELHRFIGQTSDEAPAPRCRLLRAESVIEDVMEDRMFEASQFGENTTLTSIETLLSSALAPVPPPPPALTSPGGAPLRAGRAARAVVHFARCWMTFATERCGAGRGLRPRWASQGLEFLMLACDPCNTKYLSDEEFEELKKQMDGCISHVVGRREGTSSESPATPDPARRRTTRPSPLSSTSAAVNSKEGPPPPTPPTEPNPLMNYEGEHTEDHTDRVLEAIHELDQSRDEKLRNLRAVGKVLESAAVSNYEPKLRQLKFKWQRGLKIGQGTFGKVYTVVNTDSGQLLAMKELPVAAGDRRAGQRAANELRVLEAAAHPHLVRYYGAELHREEMLLFMELCVEGSLEALVATVGALGEPTVRRYTKQLLSAVLELHTRGIVHRDIKSGNIFLTNEGHCLKLGDFGCAVKIRANTTAAGELMGHVGTQAYMAPEVFMKQTGHGRAADIWSLGCVVTEMASGKRPFSEYDSNYQIMFVVGMGGRPATPEGLSPEGRDFCRRCLTHEAEARAKAADLTMHHFLMVKSDEDCKCEAGYLKT